MLYHDTNALPWSANIERLSMQSKATVEKMTFFLLAHDPTITLLSDTISIDSIHFKILSGRTATSKYKIFFTGFANVLLWWP